MVSLSSKNFIKDALQANGDHVLSYVHTGLKELIFEHLLDLLTSFPTLFPDSGTFVYDDGTSANLLYVHGYLQLASSNAPPIPLTIWVHQAYPFVRPLVFVLTENSPHAQIIESHPYVESSSGATFTPYLEQWRFPFSNLKGLVRELDNVFSSCPPLATKRNMGTKSNSYSNNRTLGDAMVDELNAKLQHDMSKLRAQVENEVEHYSNMQSALQNRARDIENGMNELRQEKGRLEDSLWKKNRDMAIMTSWLQMHVSEPGSLFLNDEIEAFEASDATSNLLLENKAADLAIDDLLDFLGKALEREEVSFGVYIKQVRMLAREQFFKRALVKKVEDAGI